jgi:hypothetical protein
MSKSYDRRAIKRIEGFTAAGFFVYQAYLEGQYAAHDLSPRLRRNPYPKGKRRDEWQRGFNLADYDGGKLPGLRQRPL